MMWRNQSVASLNALLGIVKGNALLVGFFYSQCLSPRKNSTSLSASVSVFDLPSPLPFRARARTNHDTWSPRIDLAVAAVLGVLVWHLASAGNQRLRRYFETSDRRRPRGTRALRRSASHFAPRYYSAVGKASSPRSSGRRQ